MRPQIDEQEERGGKLLDLPPSSDGHAPGSDREPRAAPSLGAAMRRHRKFVVAPILGLLALALLSAIVRTPTYTAGTRLAVGGLNATNPVSLTGFADAAQQLAQTYSRSVQGDGVVSAVARQVDANPEQVRSHLSAAPIPETPVFTVTATSDSSAGAVELSGLASEGLVAEVNRASHADPARLLEEYRTAELEREQVSNRVDALAASGGAGLADARSELLAAEARATSLRNAYVAGQQSGTVPLQVIQKADRASSDRLSVLQIRAFIAVVFGLILGMALALFRSSPRYGKTIARATATVTSARERWSSRRASRQASKQASKKQALHQAYKRAVQEGSNQVPKGGPKRATKGTRPSPQPKPGARGSRSKRAAARRRASRRAQT